MGRQSKRKASLAPSLEFGGQRSDAILAVGLTDGQRESLPSVLFGALGSTAVMAKFTDLSRDRLWSAVAVMSPLVALDFDAVDMAKRLAGEHFQGRYYAVAVDVPDTALIQREIAAVAPDLSFQVIDISPTPSVVPDTGVRA
ncbi:MAG: hypothetical protein AAGF30_09125 [Pseudomonadota bacterium]